MSDKTKFIYMLLSGLGMLAGTIQQSEIAVLVAIWLLLAGILKSIK